MSAAGSVSAGVPAAVGDAVQLAGRATAAVAAFLADARARAASTKAHAALRGTEPALAHAECVAHLLRSRSPDDPPYAAYARTRLGHWPTGALAAGVAHGSALLNVSEASVIAAARAHGARRAQQHALRADVVARRGGGNAAVATGVVSPHYPRIIVDGSGGGSHQPKLAVAILRTAARELATDGPTASYLASMNVTHTTRRRLVAASSAQRAAVHR